MHTITLKSIIQAILLVGCISGIAITVMTVVFIHWSAETLERKSVECKPFVLLLLALVLILNLILSWIAAV